MTGLRAITAGLAALILAGCAGGRVNMPMSVTAAGEVVGELRGGDSADPREGLTAERAAASEVPLLFVQVDRRNIRTILPEVERNAFGVTYRGDGLSFTFRDGVLVATRGLGADLMAANAEALRAAFPNPAQGLVRGHEYLEGDDSFWRLALQCELAVEGTDEVVILGNAYPYTRLVETCQGGGGQVRNDYFVGRDGQMLQTRQWIGPGIGYVVTERLNP